MSFLTKYGTIWGAIPSTAGRVFWVSAGDTTIVDGNTVSASDNHDGLSPERPCRSINYVIDNLVKANAGDVVVLLPGTHTPQNASGTATSVAMDLAGVTLMGLPGGRGNYRRQKTVIAAVTTDQNINVTAADCEIAYLHFIPVSTDSAIDASADADRLHIHNCSFDMETPAADTGTIGIDFIGAASDILIEDCFFVSDGAQGAAIVVGATLGFEVRNCSFHCSGGTWVSSMTQAAAGRELLIRDCDWTIGNGVITNGCLGTTSGEVSQVAMYRCVQPDSMTKILDGYDAGDAEIMETYAAELGAGGTAGGTLVLATT